MGDYIDKIARRAKAPQADDEAEEGEDAPEVEIEVKAEPKGYGKVKARAVADLARVLGVEDDDREEFGEALSDMIAACMKGAGEEE